MIKKMKDIIRFITAIPWYIKVGKSIEDISSRYPSVAEDALILYEAWCKGVISDCAIHDDELMAYAKYTADTAQYLMWKRECGSRLRRGIDEWPDWKKRAALCNYELGKDNAYD